MAVLTNIQSGSPESLADFDAAEVNRVALSAFFSLSEAWGLTRAQSIVLLGSPSERTFYRWRSGDVAALPADTLERISVLLGIHKALHILLPEPDRANAWVKRANTAFDGASALDVMTRGRVEHLYSVRRHLDAWRGR